MKTIADQHENNTEFIEEYQRVFNGKMYFNLIFLYILYVTYRILFQPTISPSKIFTLFKPQWT